MPQLCAPLSSAVSAQEAAQLGFNCISTQLVQTPLRPTLEDLKWSLQQSQPRMHQAPLHTLEVLEGSHPCSWGANHSISFDGSKRPANYWCQSGQGKQGKNFEQKGSARIHCKASEEFNPSPFYLYNHRSSTFHQGTRKPQHCSQPRVCRRDHPVTHINTHSRLAIFGFFVCT